jgi:membrane-associated phospholipid phosphatase
MVPAVTVWFGREGSGVDGILRWGVDVILWMQQASPSLDWLFKTLTFLGSEGFFLILMPFVYWCVDRVLGIRLIVLLLSSVAINTVVKVLAAQPRPFQFDGRVKAITTETTFGFPSGHTQSSTVVWGLLGRKARRWWFWTIAVALVVGVGVSRMYLGVHFPTDVLGGLVIGLIVLWLFVKWWPRVENWVRSLSLQVQLALTGPPLLLLLVARDNDVVTGVGTMVGIGVGLILERRFVRFSTPGTVVQRALRMVVGLAVLIGIWAGLRSVFAGMEPAVLLRLARYTLVGLWAALGAPWLFTRLKIAGYRPA